MIVGYEFLLDFGDRQQWTQLHGCGGAMGAATLQIQDEHGSAEVCRQLLSRARRDHARYGVVRTSNDLHHDEPLRLIAVEPEAIIDCRPIRR